jgi:hypothetical protein
VKRLLAIPVLAVALAASAAIAPAALDDANGPTCTDITDSSWAYSLDQATATVDIFVDAASCPFVTYSLVVQDSAGETTIVAGNDAPGDGVELAPGLDVVTVSATIPLGEQDGLVCLYATTSIGRHVFDRAPDSGSGSPAGSGCVELAPGGTGAGSGWN